MDEKDEAIMEIVFASQEKGLADDIDSNTQVEEDEF